MADALLSPAVGITMWAVSGAALARCASRVRGSLQEGALPLMGVLGAFVFAVQMINFAIPGTGSSGHLAGTLFLALLMGPDAAYLALASVLVVQALFFADGGLLALGCNLFNMGFLPAFVAYPLIVKPLAEGRGGELRTVGILVGAVIGLQLGALGVVVETVLSGRADLGFKTFALAMLPIHLAIGLVEGLATWALVGFLGRLRPELLQGAGRRVSRHPAVLVAIMALVVGGAVSWYASSRPDGLEWALHRLGNPEAVGIPDRVHHGLEKVQQGAALMPDYAFRSGGESRAGTSLAGIGGGALTLVVIAGVGFALRPRRKAL
nr:energy-coupling factor ABC transporter permease [uncultured Holophaga sp.]